MNNISVFMARSLHRQGFNVFAWLVLCQHTTQNASDLLPLSIRINYLTFSFLHFNLKSQYASVEHEDDRKRYLQGKGP